MQIELRLFATVREAVGESTLTRRVAEGTTVREMLVALRSEYPALEGMLIADGEIADSVTVLRNGTHVTHFDGPETVLSDGDRLSITPPVTGG